MSDNLSLKKELKEKFIREFTPSEKLFFLRKAKEAIDIRGYRACEDLFHYCYFLTLKERLRHISPQDDGYLRLLLVETKRNIEEEIKFYEERLELTKQPVPDKTGSRFIEFLSE
ncbi:MAG: hypothetical protein M0Z35_21570 [Desulfitobacterium hafniense]|nr:hypothetical protein [Desulfitobacterium hafniense]